MKFLPFLAVFTTFGITHGTTATPGLVYTFDHQSPQSDGHPQTAGLDVARLIFAQRLGLSQYHTLNTADDITLKQLNDFGGQPMRLFGVDEGALKPAKLLVLIDGVQSPEDIFPSQKFEPSFAISSPPSYTDNERFLVDLQQQSSNKYSSQGHSCFYSIGTQGLSGTLHGVRPSSGTCPSNDDFVARMSSKKKTYIDSLADFKHVMASGFQYYGGEGSSAILRISTLSAFAKDSVSYRKAISILRDAFSTVPALAAAGEQDTIIILMPAHTHSNKRSVNAYGTHDISARSAIARQGEYEAPLSAAHAEASAAPKSGPRPNHPQTLTPAAFKSKIAVCHAAFNSCVAATNNCTGRGHCEKKYTTDNGEEKRTDCFACSCHKTTKVNEDGTIKTTFWGGSACSKKDVSMPFFLLAGFTISFMLVVAFGIGLLYSIGAEDLPSVIGAGVASQRAK